MCVNLRKRGGGCFFVFFGEGGSKRLGKIEGV